MRNDLINCGREYIAEVLSSDLYTARQELGLSRKDLSKAADVSDRTIRKYETQPVLKWTKLLSRLADALGIDLAEYGYTPPDMARLSHKVAESTARVQCKRLKYHYPYESFGRQLQAARVQHGLTQRQLAQELSICPTTVALWELGFRLLRENRLRAWAEVLGEDPEKWLKLRAAAEKARL